MLLPCLIHRPPRWLPAAILALSAGTAANAAWHHVRFDREVGPFDRAVTALGPGARVLGLTYDTRGQVMERWPYLHFEQYVVVHGGGDRRPLVHGECSAPGAPAARGPRTHAGHLAAE